MTLQDLLQVASGGGAAPPPGEASSSGPSTSGAEAAPETSTIAAPTSLDAKIASLPKGPQAALKAVRAGVLPGVAVPDGAPQLPSSVTPTDIVEYGVGFYLPRDPKVKAVLYNPLKLTEKMLQRLDVTGRLLQVFPPITKWLGGDTPPAPRPTTENTTSPEGSPALDAGVFSTGLNAPKPRRVPILPRGGPLVEMREPETPSRRYLPGAGVVLNQLLRPPA